MRSARVAIAALSLSAAGLVGLAIQEGYTDQAIIPTKGDKPTLGFGMTERPDGSPVQMSDKTNPVEALQRTLAWVQKGEAKFKRCVTAPLHQAEYDLYVDHMYNVGTGAFCASDMVKHLNALDYVDACNQFPRWKFAGKTDCSVPGNRICGGLWKRRLEAQAKCLELQR